MSVHNVAEAFPNGNTSADAIRQKLATGFASVIIAADDIEDLDFLATNAVAIPEIIIVRATGLIYARDPDNTDGHNGVTVLVSASGHHYVAPLAPQAFTNVLAIQNAPPASPAAGDRYIVGTAPSGAFASNAEDLAYFDGLQWVFVNAVIGQTVYVRGETGHYHYSESGDWESGVGLTTIAEGQIGALEQQFPFGEVIQSETTTPPGTRATGATPTMPLGGTAANINDDATGTVGTTSALGNLTGAAASARIVAKLDLGADVALSAVEAKQFRASTGSSSSGAIGFYYATAAAPTTLVQLGSGFTLSATPTDFVRSGSFTARYVFLVTEAKDWSTATHTLSDLNAYRQATSLADGTKYIVAENAIGAFSGHDTEVAEARDGAFIFHVPYDGASVFDLATNAQRRYDDGNGVWESAAGVWIDQDYVTDQTTGNQAAISSTFYGNWTTTPPTITHSARRDDKSIAYTAKRAGALLKLSYRAMLVFNLAGGTNLLFAIAVFRDSETSPVAYRAFVPHNGNAACDLDFFFAASDDQSHTYKVHAVAINSSNFCSEMKDRTFEIQERA